MDFRSIVFAMKILVIGSCTGDKNIRDCRGVIEDRQLSSFREPVRLQRPRHRSIPPLSASTSGLWPNVAGLKHCAWRSFGMMRRRLNSSATKVKSRPAQRTLILDQQGQPKDPLNMPGVKPSNAAPAM
jgi:hypothetical protein